MLPVVNYVNAINLALTATMGAIMTLNGSFSIGALTSYLQLTITYNQPFKQISMQVNNVLQGLAGAKRIFTVLDESGKAILRNISLYAKPGQKIAFVGNQSAI